MRRDSTSVDDGPGTETGTRHGGDGRNQFRQWTDETREQLLTAETARVDVYVRSMLPPAGAKESQTDLLARLEDVAADSPIGDVTVSVWGERICLCDRCRGTEAGRVMLNTVRDLEAWGEEFDAAVAPFFERQTLESAVTDGTYEGISPPRVTAALRVDGTLNGVFPCRMGEDHVSVHDFSARLAAMSETEPPTESVGRSH